MHLMLEQRPDYWKWATLAGQNDPQVQSLLREHIGSYADLIPPRQGARSFKPYEEWGPPFSKDWLDGRKRKGVWFRSLTARRWEVPPLGLDSRGKVSVMRPIYQYIVTHVDDQGRLLMDSKVPVNGEGRPGLIVNPYSPHTISSTGRPCNGCHSNTKAVGLGRGMIGIAKPGPVLLWSVESGLESVSIRWDAIIDKAYNAAQFSSHPNAGPLPPGVARRLMRPSKRHKALWSRRVMEMELDLDTILGPE
jgi:hypothetical protein